MLLALFCKWQEYHDNIGDLDGPEEKERAQARIQKFISAFWWLYDFLDLYGKGNFTLWNW